MTRQVDLDGGEAFVRAEAGWLARCAYLLTGDRDRALDLSQETALKVWRSWAKVSAADDRHAYVATMMLNTYRSGLRRRRPREVPLDLVESTRVVATGPTASYDDADAVMRALQGLPLRQRAAIVMRYWADLDTPAIAEALGCRPSSVRSLLARATGTLRTELDEDDHG